MEQLTYFKRVVVVVAGIKFIESVECKLKGIVSFFFISPLHIITNS